MNRDDVFRTLTEILDRLADPEDGLGFDRATMQQLLDSGQVRWQGQPALSVYRYLLRPPPRDREGYIQRSAEVFGLVGSTGFERDEQYIRERAARHVDLHAVPVPDDRRRNDFAGRAFQHQDVQLARVEDALAGVGDDLVVG